MANSITNRREFERIDLQVKAFWSKVHPDFYIVTAFGFPAYIYVLYLDRWFGVNNYDMISANTQHMIYPNARLEGVSAEVLTDIYRRGVAGLAKWRILG